LPSAGKRDAVLIVCGDVRRPESLRAAHLRDGEKKCIPITRSGSCAPRRCVIGIVEVLDRTRVMEHLLHFAQHLLLDDEVSNTASIVSSARRTGIGIMPESSAISWRIRIS